MTTRTLLLAAAAVALTAGPALAQVRSDTDAGRSWTTPHQSGPSAAPTDSPQHQSLTGRQAAGSSAAQSGHMGSTRSSGISDNQAGSTYGSQSGTYDNRGTVPGSRAGMSGSTGAGTGMSGSASTGDHNFAGRRGRGQNEKELVQTSLLNEFSGMGFTAVRDFQKRGDNYVATVQDQSGRWMNVELDPRTGQITEAR